MNKLATIIMLVLVLIALSVKSAGAEIEAEDAGILPGKYRVSHVDETLTKFKLEYIEQGTPWFCEVIETGHCVDPDKYPPKKGDIYIKSGNQKFSDIDGITQDIRWDSRELMECYAYAPNVEKACTCDGYRNTVKKNGSFLFNLDLLANGNTWGSVVNLVIGDSVSVDHTWNGGSPKNDPCFSRVEVKVKIHGVETPKYASCNDLLTCIYYASQIGTDKYATITDRVFFKDGTSCYGTWEGFDPDGYEDPEAPVE